MRRVCRYTKISWIVCFGFNYYHFWSYKSLYSFPPCLLSISPEDCDGGTCVPSKNDADICVCQCTGCLQTKQSAVQPPESTDDVGCVIKCDCDEQCSTFNETYPELTNWTAGTCSEPCTTCTNSSTCKTDQDCIILPDEDSGICVGSGVCTKSKNKLCDEAWNVITGGNDKSAKCCPASSGCIKGSIGVIATSTCSVTCGKGSCLGVTDKKSKYLPSTFCSFGQRLRKLFSFEFHRPFALTCIV